MAQLENDLEYGNGSLAKAKSMSADRLYKVAQYFGVSMEYLITGKTINEADDEVSILRQQQSILMDINKISQLLTEYYKKIDECKDNLIKLKKDYNALENKKKKHVETETIAPSSDIKWSLPWEVPAFDPSVIDLPFDNKLNS